MKISLWFSFAVLLPILLSGCSLFRDDRPAPQGSPYAVDTPPKTSEKIYSEADAVNAAVSAISLRMACTPGGPFRIAPVQGHLSFTGAKVYESLVRMGLSRNGALRLLLIEDRFDGNEWTVVLRMPPQRNLFFSKTYRLKGEKQP